MKRKNRILVAIVIVVIVVGTGTLIGVLWSPQTPNVSTVEEERLEILKKAVNMDLVRYLDYFEWKENGYLSFDYEVEERGSDGIEEIVYVGIEENGEYQKYWIYGRGEEIFEVVWRTNLKKVELMKRRLWVERRKGNLDYSPTCLPEEKVEELFEKSRQYYFKVKKHFGVDTNEGLRKKIEEVRKEEIRKLRELEFK